MDELQYQLTAEKGVCQSDELEVLHWHKDPLFAKMDACKRPEDFQSWFEEIGMDFESACWRGPDWWKENGQCYHWQEASLKMIWDAMRRDERFPSWGHFLAFMDRRVGYKTYLSYARAVSACKQPLDFIVYFADLGIPSNKWENSEWLSHREEQPSEKGGMVRKLSGLVGAIRGDERWDGSYPKFVAWMYGKEAPEPSMAERVRAWEIPEDFDQFCEDFGIVGNGWKAMEWWTSGAKKPKEEGGVGRRLSGVSNAVITDDRWENWEAFVAWAERRAPKQTWFEKIEPCHTREEFLAFFEQEKLTVQQWRNSDWLSKNRKGLLHALMHRFDGKFRNFLAWMDGMPFEGIASPEEAKVIIDNEALRLSCSVYELLTKEKVMRGWRKSPATTMVLEYFAGNLSREKKKERPIDPHEFLARISTEYSHSFLTKKTRAADESIQTLLATLQDRYRIALGGTPLATVTAMNEAAKRMYTAEHEVFVAEQVPENVQKTIQQLRNHARIIVEEQAGWQQPLRVHHKMTDLGMQALNLLRARFGLPAEEPPRKKEKKEHSPKKRRSNGMPNPPNLVVSDIVAFEQACNEKLEDLNVQDAKKRAFTSEGKTYEESPMLVFLRVGKSVFGKDAKNVGTSGKRYLILVRDGKSHDDAKKLIEDEEKNPPGQLPAPPALVADHLRAFEVACGLPVKEFKKDDRKKRSFTVGESTYRESPAALLHRLKKALVAEGDTRRISFEDVLRYLSLILEGQMHDAAKQQLHFVKKAQQEVPSEESAGDAENRIWVLDPGTLTPDHISAFEGACGVSIEDMKLDDTEDRMFSVQGKTYGDNPEAFFYRIAEAFDEGGRANSVGKRYVILLKSGTAITEARRFVLDEVAMDKERAQMRLPTPPALTCEHVLAFETACECTVENMSASDTTDRTFTVGEAVFQDNPRQLLHRTARLIANNSRTADVGKKYLMLIRDGLDDELARIQVLQGLSEMELTQLPALPAHPNLTSAHVQAFEAACGRRLEDMSVLSNERKVFTANGTSFNDSMQTLCYRVCRYALHSQGNVKGAARDYLILLRDGTPPEEARTKVREAMELVVQVPPLPNPPDLTAEHITAFELAVGNNVESFSVGDQERRQCASGEQMYEDSPLVLLGRVMRSIAGPEAGRAALGKIYLAKVRDGSSHEDAQQAVLVKLAETGPELPQLPVPPELTVQYIRAIADAYGMPLECISVNNNEMRKFTVGDHSFEDSFCRLLDRVGRSMKTQKTRLGYAKHYLIFLRDGMECSDALAKAIAESDAHPPKPDVLPGPPNLTSELLQHFEVACDNIPIANMSVHDRTRRTLVIGTVTYYESPAALFMRLARAITVRKNARSSFGKLYAVHIRNGLSHDDAFAKVKAQMESESQYPKLPNPPILNAEHIGAFEAACECFMETVSTFDTGKRIITIGDAVFEDSPAALGRRTAYAIFGPGETGDLITALTRKYLCMMREGAEHAVAVETVKAEYEAKKEKLFIDVTGVSPVVLASIQSQLEEGCSTLNETTWRRFVSLAQLPHEVLQAEEAKREAADRLTVLRAWIKQLIILDRMEWEQRLLALDQTSDAYRRLFMLLDIDLDKKERGANLQNREEYSASGAKIRYCPLQVCLRRHHGSWQNFYAKMQGRLPMTGFQSFDEVLMYANREILRLKTHGHFHGGSEALDTITDRDYDIFFRRSNIGHNLVLREIDAFMQNQEI